MPLFDFPFSFLGFICCMFIWFPFFLCFRSDARDPGLSVVIEGLEALIVAVEQREHWLTLGEIPGQWKAEVIL